MRHACLVQHEAVSQLRKRWERLGTQAHQFLSHQLYLTRLQTRVSINTRFLMVESDRAMQIRQLNDGILFFGNTWAFARSRRRRCVDKRLD